MKITLRSKPVANGSRSLFLEYYEKGKRTYEFLRLYLIPEVDEQTKRENENALKKAQAIKAERTIHPDTIPCEESKQQEKTRLAKEKDNKVTFMEWMDEYQRMMQDNGTYSNAAINQAKTIKDAVCQYLGSIHKNDILLSKIDKDFVYGFLQFLGNGYVQKHWRKENKPLSDSTLRAYQTKFNTILNKAVKEGKMKANPFYQLDKSQTYRKCKGEREYLTIDEVQRFMAVETEGKETQRAFAFACFTGLRISDIRSLKWTDIKNPDTAPTIVMEQTKTHDVVRVPLGKIALSLLPERRDSGNIFHLPTATAVHFSCKWIAEHAGIKKNVSFHTSRHTFATLTLSACNDLKLVSELLGHKSVKTTQRYAEVMLANKTETVNRVDEVFTSKP